ncbi:DUF6079 family protein [Actinoplanes oblitus]|uniref:DUF6079 family protein n=1 Tax=Actinoplanes oblitus TaxID=3040509 RepID=A0ABY8WGJ9_9ACTN|nr:DUF6079 family protein [Actinoplanes oblitus]WIM96999.1 DUF6079 family protein [Actinoplanes oblitus]
MSTLLRDIIKIPETAGADDYVLRLTEGVGSGRLARTIKEYVVTDQLAEAFDSALGLVVSALRDDQSRAAFLSGSFGSGKSHFMAVLYALLGHDANARGKTELQPAVARHDTAISGKKFLRLAFHFLDARSIDETILGGYVAQIQALHPGCDLPAVHRSDAVLADAEALRLRLGDDTFFAGLNGGGDVWSGVLEGGAWNAERYDRARSADFGDEDRTKLVSALVRHYFTAFTSTAEFVPLDEGLSAISAHAKSLGYDAVVLFLDELVLWLSFSVRDRQFFGREAQKITKLVESGFGERAIPLISFVARQLDLKRYFADAGGGVGAEQEALDNAFRHQEGRFLTIKLGDDNLPYVAEKRLLEPHDEAARAVLHDAFRQLDRRPEVWDVLLDGVNTDDSHRGSDQEAFRRTYPFSPALVSTLRTLASAMQRDRTALKVMQQLLVQRRDYLTIDDIVPVGDVFELVVDGNQALTPEMAGRFKNARALYDNKIRPLLLREHKLAEADIAGLPQRHPFHADDRLVKTLVLSAVAPEVPALKELTGSRLAALNHGSITAPAFRGREGSLVVTKVRRWQRDVPELQITGDPRNPVIRVRIAEVDYESIVEKAKGEDNDGRQRETLKRLVWDALALDDIDGDAFGVSRQQRIWRGSRREAEVVFGNVRDRAWLTDGVFEAGPDTWRFVIDYPFDADGRSALEDLNRIEDLKGRVVSRTVVWVPHFLGAERLRDLGRLVILDWLLGGSGDRWTTHANHLAEADRVQARIILETQRDALRERLRQAIQEAYGAASPTQGTLEMLDGHDRVLFSLHPEFNPTAPVGHDLSAAFSNLIDQAFSAVFPGHPRFEPEDREIRVGELTAVLHAVEAARQDPDGRAFIEPAKREAVRRVANPLGVGHMGETHFLFGADRFRWDMQLATAMGRDGLAPGDPVDVKRLRSWITSVTPPTGLRPEIVDLVICAWSILHSRAWYRYGTALASAPQPGSLSPEMELRPEPLPSADDWKLAVERVGHLFGVFGNPYLTGQSVTELTETLSAATRQSAGAAGALVTSLEKVYQRFGLDVTAGSGRLATARAASGLLAALESAGDRVRVVEVLARHELPATPQAVSRSLTSAAKLVDFLKSFAWDRLRPVQDAAGGNDDRSLDARNIVERLRIAVTADELAQSLQSALQRAEDDAFKWAILPPAPIPTPTPTPPPTSTRGGRRTIASSADLDAVLAEVRAFAEQTNRTIVIEWREQQ